MLDEAFYCADADELLVLSKDMTTAMRLLGVTSLDQVRPEMVNASQILNDMWRPEKTAKLSRL
jgi:L-lactate dehydrogenase (cytochrome)